MIKVYLIAAAAGAALIAFGAYTYQQRKDAVDDALLKIERKNNETVKMSNHFVSTYRECVRRYPDGVFAYDFAKGVCSGPGEGDD